MKIRTGFLVAALSVSAGALADGRTQASLADVGITPVQVTEQNALYGEGWRDRAREVAKGVNRARKVIQNTVKASNYLDGCGYRFWCQAH